MDQLSSTVATSNISSSPGPLAHPSWNSTGLVPAVMMSFFIALGVPGNIAVIILRPKWEQLSSLSQTLLLNLAIADLLCLLTLSAWMYAFLYGWAYGLVACKLLAYFEYCTLSCSLLTVTGLSVQRYLVVVRRQSCQQIKRGLILVLLWLIAFIASIPSLIVRKINAGQWTDCIEQPVSNAQFVAVRLTDTLFGLIAFSIVVFSYICVKRTIHQAAFFNRPQTTRLVDSIIVSLFVLWAPYHIINMLGVLALCLNNESWFIFYINTINIAGSVVFVNCWLNPLLYAFSSYTFCADCKREESIQQSQRNPPNPHIATVAQLS